MARTLRTAALVVGAVALVATGVGALASIGALGAAAAGATGVVAGISTATIATIGTFAAVGAAALGLAAGLAAPKPSASGSGTTFTTNPQSGLPYAIGRTRMSGLRIFAKTNTTPGYTKFNDLLWFGAMLSIGGPIEGIEAFTADNELVTFDASGHAIGRFANYMSQKVHLGGPQASGLAVTLNGGSPPGWTAAHRLSGVTHAMWGLRFNKEGQLYGAGAPEPAWIGKWVKVYDPRLDSSYPGGSGACRPLIETTYVWSQNPGLHALTWALGRVQNGLRTCGIGAPIDNIRVQEFVECANICDANGWKVGGVEWTTDSKWDTFKRILQAGGSVPTQTGAMIGCLVSTPRTAIATIEAHHLLDRLSFPSTKSRRDRYNTVIPRYVDEASDWSLISGAKIQVGAYVTADRGQRTKEVDFPLVQVFTGEDAVQPGQLAAYCIVNSREAGPFSWTTGPEWAGLKTGDVIYLNVPEEGLVNQPILITKRAPDPATGKINFAGDTETYSKHSFALGQSTTPPSPFSLTAPDLVPPAPRTSVWSLSGSLTGEGLPCLILSGAPEHPSAEAVLVDYRIVGATEWTKSAILPATQTILHVIAPLASSTLYEVRVGYRVGAIDGLYTVLPAVFTGAGKLSTIEEGATVGASPSESALLAQLDADTAQALADIGAAEDTIEALLADVEGVTTTVAAQNASISSISSVASAAAGDVAQLKTEVRAGNPNLQPNGGFENGLSGWYGNTGYFAFARTGWGAFAYTYNAGGLTGFHFLYSDPVRIEGPYTLTATADVEINGAGSAYLQFDWYNDTSYLGSSYGPSLVGPVGFNGAGINRAALKLTAAGPSGTTRYVMLLVGNMGGGPSINWRQVKVETGTVATPYSNEASVIQTFSALSTINNQYASLTTTVSVQGVAVSTNAAAIATTNGNVTTLFARAAVTLAVGGYMTGWEQNNNGTTGNFKIHADYFEIEKPGGGSRTSFSSGTWKVYDGSAVVVELGYLA